MLKHKVDFNFERTGGPSKITFTDTDSNKSFEVLVYGDYDGDIPTEFQNIYEEEIEVDAPDWTPWIWTGYTENYVSVVTEGDE